MLWEPVVSSRDSPIFSSVGGVAEHEACSLVTCITSLALVGLCDECEKAWLHEYIYIHSGVEDGGQGRQLPPPLSKERGHCPPSSQAL